MGFVSFLKSTVIQKFFYLNFNVVGIPLHKCTKESFRPILCKVKNFPTEPPFVDAIYCGVHLTNIFLSLYLEQGILISNTYVKVIYHSF